MFEVRIHGRGGQGVVTAAELLATAALAGGHQAQAFPSFGPERTGAPVVAFCRIAEHPIRLREPAPRPDALIVQDPTLLHQINVFADLAPDGQVLLNTRLGWHELGLQRIDDGPSRERTWFVPATDLAREHVGRTAPNAALLGGFAALCGLVSLPAVAEAIRRRFRGGVAEGNVAAANAAYDLVRAQQRERVHA